MKSALIILFLCIVSSFAEEDIFEEVNYSNLYVLVNGFNSLSKLNLVKHLFLVYKFNYN